MMRLLILLLLFAFSAPAFAQSPDACDPQVKQNYTPLQERYQRGLLFLVTYCGKPSSYLFATIHSDNPDIIKTAKNAFDALKNVRTAVFEYVMNAGASAEAQKMMYYPPKEKGLKARLGNRDFSRLLEAFERQGNAFPAEIVDRMRPWAAAVMLQSPPDKSDGVVLDDLLQRTASKSKIQLVGLETPKEQFAVFNNLPDDKQMEMVREAMEDQVTMDKMNVELDRTYLDKNLYAIADLGKRSFEEISDGQLREYMEKKLLIERNNNMVQRMEPRLQIGNAFIAVGALHYPGPEGIISQLEQKGYLIFPVANN